MDRHYCLAQERPWDLYLLEIAEISAQNVGGWIPHSERDVSCRDSGQARCFDKSLHRVAAFEEYSADSSRGTAILVLSIPAWVKWPWRRLGRAEWTAVLQWDCGLAHVQYLGKGRFKMFRG